MAVKHDANEPRFHRTKGVWYKKIQGRIHYLGEDFDNAKHELAKLWERLRKGDQHHQEWLKVPLIELCDEYVTYHENRGQMRTATSMRERLKRCMRGLGTKGVLVGEARRFHLTKIEAWMRKQKHPKDTDRPRYSETSIRDSIGALQAVFGWAVRQDYLQTNPLAGHPKPRGRRRTRTLTDEEFRQLLGATYPAFRRFLLAMRLTGCRPGELRGLRWEDVLLDESLWVIRQHKTIGSQHEPMPRVIPLPLPVLKLCRWLARHRIPHIEYVFLNRRRQPYTRNAVVQAMESARREAGIASKAGENAVAYSLRHTFGTASVGKVSDIELAAVMGHTNPRMTAWYAHLNWQRVKEIRDRIG